MADRAGSTLDGWRWLQLGPPCPPRFTTDPTQAHHPHHHVFWMMILETTDVFGNKGGALSMNIATTVILKG